jgi:hypothetical protein
MAERKLEFKDNIHLSQLAVRVDQEETDYLFTLKKGICDVTITLKIQDRWFITQNINNDIEAAEKNQFPLL